MFLDIIRYVEHAIVSRSILSSAFGASGIKREWKKQQQNNPKRSLLPLRFDGAKTKL
jgi:hypothetical protein